MKATTTVVAITFLLVLAGLCSTRSPAKAAEPDITQMISTAKTAADHEAIADYYDKAAAEAEQMADKHTKMEEAYKTSPSLRSAGPGFWRVGARDCQAQSNGFKNIADKDKALAKLHREMAKKLAH